MGKTKLFLRDKELETLDNVSKNVGKKIIKAQAGIVYSEELEMIILQQKNVLEHSIIIFKPANVLMVKI